MSAAKFKHEKVEERSDSSSIEILIERSGCSAEFYALETCMGESETRNWSSCQSQVKALKLCNLRQIPASSSSFSTTTTITTTSPNNNTK